MHRGILSNIVFFPSYIVINYSERMQNIFRHVLRTEINLIIQRVFAMQYQLSQIIAITIVNKDMKTKCDNASWKLIIFAKSFN